MGNKRSITADDPHQVCTRKSSLILQRPEGPQELAEDLPGKTQRPPTASEAVGGELGPWLA